eukprot:scaffold980_cov92-Skeletonema_dohrnii-CCMP3373.AAC.1
MILAGSFVACVDRCARAKRCAWPIAPLVAIAQIMHHKSIDYIARERVGKNIDANFCSLRVIYLFFKYLPP